MKRQPLFCAWWTDTAAGTRIGRATQSELRTACRLWWEHKDLREHVREAADELAIHLGQNRFDQNERAEPQNGFGVQGTL